MAATRFLFTRVQPAEGGIVTQFADLLKAKAGDAVNEPGFAVKTVGDEIADAFRQGIPLPPDMLKILVLSLSKQMSVRVSPSLAEAGVWLTDRV